MNRPAPRCHSVRPCNRGMTLIEILVGLAIALVAALIVFQVFAVSDQRNRSTASGSDAQVAGALALFQLERDIKMAGFGFGMLPRAGGDPGGVGGCKVAAHNRELAAPDFTFPLAPVSITQGTDALGVVDGSPDQIAVLYGNSAYYVTSRKFHNGTSPGDDANKKLIRRDAFQMGDVVLVTNNGTNAAAGICALVEITNKPNIDLETVEHVQDAVYASFYGGNPTAKMNATAGAATFVAGAGIAYNLGPRPSRNVWRVTAAGAADPNMLVWRNSLQSDAWQQVSEGIVNLKAEYGVDDGGGAAGGAAVPPAVAKDGIISPTEWTSTAPADPTRLLAVRFAVLARSPQYEKTAVTTALPFWANDPGPLASRTANDGAAHKFTLFNVDGTADNAPGNANDWRHYRYRVYEATVPLRNLLWGSLPPPP
ncbi:MAG: PilW family protein [Betaproteobacteria bacterium]